MHTRCVARHARLTAVLATVVLGREYELGLLVLLHGGHGFVQTDDDLVSAQLELERLVAQMSRVERLVVHLEVRVVMNYFLCQNV